jgi:hypothetical protein
VDLAGGISRTALAGVLAAAPSDESGPDADARKQLTIGKAYDIARTTLSRELAGRVEEHQARVARRLSAETGRLHLYYAALAEELSRRRQSPRGGAPDAGDIGERRQAIWAECERKMAEMAEKYRLRPAARLAALRVHTYPRLFTTVTLERRQTSRSVDLAFDPVLGRLLPPGCEACRRESTFLELLSDGSLACRQCAERRQETIFSSCTRAEMRG